MKEKGRQYQLAVLAQFNNMFRILVEIHEEQEEIDEKNDDEIWFGDMNQKIFYIKHKVHSWLKEGEKLRKSDQVSRCSSKSSLKHNSKSSAKSSSSSKSKSSTKAKAIKEKVKAAEFMMEASFIKKRRDAEYQTCSLLVEGELAKAQTRAEIYENKSKIGQSRKTKPSIPNVHTNISGRECSRPSRNQSHLIWQLYQMLIQEGIQESYILVGVMVMKRSAILPVHRQ